ncbi:MAG: thioredoxin family protein [Paracoccaceae bacterium]
MAVSPPVCEFDWPAPAFTLPATDGQSYSFDRIAGPKGTLIMFICNHCPYVKSVLDRIERDARDLHALGVGVAAICSNDAAAYPEDGFNAMAALAQERGFSFPYLHDADQTVARAYGAACTPDFFGFNAAGGLQYRGRLDASGRNAVRRAARTVRGDVAGGTHGPRPSEQVPSMGCSIKWKAA